jgi:hypothetical protein
MWGFKSPLAHKDLRGQPFDSIAVTAVDEDLAHLPSATRAYVIFHVPDDQAESAKVTIEETCHIGRSHRVGVIVMGDPSDGVSRLAELDRYELVQPLGSGSTRRASWNSSQVSDRIARALH